jgi:membrane fusion protein, heavy metal efflux system
MKNQGFERGSFGGAVMWRGAGALLLCGCLLALLGCGAGEPAKTSDAEEVPTFERTSWTTKTEAFLDGDALVAGETSQFTLHITRLDTLRPLTAGEAELRIARDGGFEQRFHREQPNRPGIFTFDVSLARPGEFRLHAHFQGEGMEDSHDLGTLTCFASRSDLPAPEEDDEPNAIAFFKDQQWTLDLAIDVIAERPLRRSLRVPAEVLPRSGGQAEVSVPFDGRLVAERIPVIGARVTQGEVLASLLPPTSAPSDLAVLALAREEAQLALEFARKDRERAQRLVESGAAPAKRLDEAQTAEATQLARVKAADDRLAQYDSSSTADGLGVGAKLFTLRAPISGMLTMVDAAPNANVKAGDILFRIVDADTVYVSAVVPETELAFVRELSGAQLEIPGGGLRPLSRLITVGRMVDPMSRTFPVVYEVDNRDRAIAIHQTLHVHLMTRQTEAAPVVPESALVDDGGRPVIFVQTAGETFVRRPVRLGTRDSGYVQILEGAKPGDRVVTRGAHLIRLAALSTQVPAEGHVH